MKQERRSVKPVLKPVFAEKGFSIIEMLITTALFAVIMVVSTQSLATSLKNSRKSDSISKARENADFAVSTMERLLRNAKDVTACSDLELEYTDEYGKTSNFTCDAGSFIASGSAGLRITSTSVNIDCTGTVKVFNCPAPAIGVPQAIEITVKASDASSSGAEGADVISKTKVLLRNYVNF